MLSAFKNFLVTFLVAALLFGIVGYFTTGYISSIVTGILDGERDKLGDIINNTPENTDEGKVDEPQVDPDLKVPDGESFTFVVVGTDYRPDLYTNYYNTADKLDELTGGITDSEDSLGILDTNVRYINATWIALVRADKENREFVSCYITPETRVSAPSGDATLGDVYGRYGISVLCDYISAMTGLTINYSFVIDGINGIDFLSSMGSVNFDLKSDIYSAGGYHVSASTSVVPKDPKDTDDTAAKADDPEEAPSGDENSETETVDNVFVLGAGGQSLSDYSTHILNTFKEYSQGDVDTKSGYILEMLKQYLTRCSEWSEEELTRKITDLTREKSYSAKTNNADQNGDDENTTSDAPAVSGGHVLTGVFDDPYASKPVLATNFSHENVVEIYSMLGAIEYFDYFEIVYPGTFSETENCYVPDITAALEQFAKYKPN